MPMKVSNIHHFCWHAAKEPCAAILNLTPIFTGLGLNASFFTMVRALQVLRIILPFPCKVQLKNFWLPVETCYPPAEIIM